VKGVIWSILVKDFGEWKVMQASNMLTSKPINHYVSKRDYYLVVVDLNRSWKNQNG